MVLPTFAETKVGRTEGYQLQFEKPILRLHCAEPMTFKYKAPQMKCFFNQSKTTA